MSSNVLTKTLIFSAFLIAISPSFSQSNEKFSKCNTDQQISHKNRAGHVKILICTGVEDGVTQWQYTDGSSTLGEIFNPAKDCADIVDHLAGAEDGFYWIALDNKTKHKIWCDVHTDGGGFTLVGMKDTPVPWRVASNPTPVDPQGPAHWSSRLGDILIQDFRVQVSANKSFEGTKADWFYRFKYKRPLGNLLTNNVSSGCKHSSPGVGDIKYVKDVRTGSVSTRNFKCSIFGPHTHPNLGWARMNHCLRNDCKDGYGVFPGPIPYSYTQYGSFSYSTVSGSSGTERNSTAFVGCDGGKCCACFGPKGGRQNYCGPQCSTHNGGSVEKNIFVWFWVRTRIPERLWKRCMEFKTKNVAGTLEKYFIDPRTGSAHKGSCSVQFKALLNEGTLTVTGKKSFENIPDVPGLLSYRTDNKQLYVNEGTKWEPLGKDEEVQQLKQELKTQQKTIRAQGEMIQELKSSIKQLHVPGTCSEFRWIQPNRTFSNGMYNICPGGRCFDAVSVYCDMISESGVGVTVIGHDSESSIKVDGYDSPGSYRRKIKYDISMEQIVRIIKQSQKCEQFVKYKCHNAGFWFKISASWWVEPFSWWVSRNGAKMTYWGGANPSSSKCACGMTTSCVNPSLSCNCDQNTNIWTEDSGFLTDRNTLPVTEFRFGDTGTQGSHNEVGYHTLGKLRCWG